MLHNPKWDAMTKPDIFSLASLVSWLETMPADQIYDYRDCGGECLYGQYATAHGVLWEKSGACGRRGSSQERYDFCGLVYSHIASHRPWTFGAALERALAVSRPERG